MNHHIIEMEVMLEGVWPELGGQTGTGKHHTERVADGLMQMLARTILMRGVGSSWFCWFNLVPSLRKQVNNVGALTKLATKIKADVLVRHVLWETMLDKPAIEELERWCFGAKRLTIQHATVMISDQAVACLTIETL